MTESLEKLAGWMSRLGIRQVAMESTGSYWKPVWAILEGKFELLLVNAAHIPGVRPTLRMPNGSPICTATACCGGVSCRRREIQDLRDLTRYRAQLTEERSAASNRISKILETGGQRGDGRQRPGHAAGADHR